MNPKGIILTGGPNSCYEENSPTYTKELFELGIPVLGLCYGAQLMMHILGGKVEKAPVREYGKTDVFVKTDSPLFTDVSEKTVCWMSHFDYISKTAPGFEIEFRLQCVRLQRRLEDGFLCGAFHSGDPQKSRKRQGALCSFRWRGFFRCSSVTF